MVQTTLSKHSTALKRRFFFSLSGSSDGGRRVMNEVEEVDSAMALCAKFLNLQSHVVGKPPYSKTLHAAGNKSINLLHLLFLLLC
jgi:hypothetical protein